LRRILLLIKGLGRGGAEQLLASAAPYLDRGRFRYEVAYLLPWKDDLVAELEAAGLRVHCLGARGPSWIANLVALVRNGGFDLVHAHSPVPAIGARVAFPRRARLPIVYTEHNVWERYQRATFWANALTFARNDHVIAVSEHVRASIRYPVPLRRLPMPTVETRYYGVDPTALASVAPVDGVREELGVPSDVPVVGTVANFKPGKGHRYLVEAAARVRRAVPDVRFVLVGRGPTEPDARRWVRELGLESSFVFAGFREDAPKVMRTFDVLAVPSVHDGLSIALLEAMSLGKPAVLTRAGGNAEVVRDGEQGLVVPRADPDALADGIVRLLRDDGLRVRMGTAAKAQAMGFDIRDAVQRTEEIYEGLLR